MYRRQGGMSVEQFERLPDDDTRQELVHGTVVREPPAGYEHGRVASIVGALLRQHVEAHALGEVCGAETGFVLSEDPPLVRAPDAAFVARKRVPQERVRGFFRGAPDLAVEVLSASNSGAVTEEKVANFLAAGTRCVWVLDPDARTITVHDAAGRTLVDAGAEVDGGTLLPGFRVPVGRIFGD